MRMLLHSQETEWSALDLLAYSFLLTLFVTGVFAFIGFAYPSHKSLPNIYYKIKDPRLLASIYRTMRVKYFRYMLLFAFWGRKNHMRKYFNGTKQGLKNFIFQTKQSEFGHFAALITTLTLSIILLFQGYKLMAVMINIINIIGNLYPVILQRWHRMRIERITSKIK